MKRGLYIQANTSIATDIHVCVWGYKRDTPTRRWFESRHVFGIFAFFCIIHFHFSLTQSLFLFYSTQLSSCLLLLSAQIRYTSHALPSLFIQFSSSSKTWCLLSLTQPAIIFSHRIVIAIAQIKVRYKSHTSPSSCNLIFTSSPSHQQLLSFLSHSTSNYLFSPHFHCYCSN